MKNYHLLCPRPIRRHIPIQVKRRAWYFLGDKRPLLSVIVPAYNVEKYLANCLDSITSQGYKNIEVIIVDDGSQDSSYEIAKQYRRKDKRVRIIRQRNQGLGAARNTGIKYAKGRYLTFADSDDTIPIGTYEKLMSTLLASRSDFIVGSVQRIDNKKKWIPKWAQKAHAVDRIGINVNEHPDIILNVFAWNKIFVREFFIKNIKGFPEGIRYEDQEPSIMAYTFARSFDVSSIVAYNWHSRSDGSSISQQKATLQDITDRMTVMSRQESFLRKHGDSAIYTRLLSKIFGFDLWAYYDQIARQNMAYWEVVQKGMSNIAENASRDVMQIIDPIDRFFLNAILKNNREDFISIAAHVDAYGKDYVLQKFKHRLIADVPLLGSLQNPPSTQSLIVDTQQLTPIAKIYDIRIDDCTITVYGSIHLKHLAHNESNHTQIKCICLNEGEWVEPIEFKQNLDISRFENNQHKYLDYTKTGFLAKFIIHKNTAVITRPRYAFAFKYTFAGNCIEGILDTIHRSSPSAYGDCVNSKDGQAYLIRKSLMPDTRSIGMILYEASPKYLCRVQKFRKKKYYLEVTHINLSGTAVRLIGQYKIPRGSLDITLALFSDTGNGVIHPYFQRVGGGEFECIFDFSKHQAYIASNKCVFKLRYTNKQGGQRKIWSFCSLGVNAKLPLTYSSGNCCIKISRTPKAGAIHINIQPPWLPEECGNYNRSRMILRYLDTVSHRENLRSNVFLFETFNGSRIDDSPLAISKWVLKNIPHAKIYWSIRDRSIEVPSGMIGVIKFSQEWFDLLARAQILINNNNFPYFFKKTCGQKYLQTWHGTPLKKIGNDVPQNNLSLSYRKLMSEEISQWDILLAQNEFSRKVLPNAFGYKGTVLCEGYPRNDSLVNTDKQLSIAVKSNLGIPLEKKVLLYAPTWRDTSKHSRGGYNLEVFLDISEFIKEVDNYVILLRGHPNTLHSSRPYDDVIDVRDYPRINDLYLASDILVTDYSSVMFDFAITGKPMLFLVPDLEKYSQKTRGFYMDLKDIAPGPLCYSTSDLIQNIKDIEEKGYKYSQRYLKFRNNFCSKDDGDATDRVMSAFMNIIEQQ